MGVLKPAVLTSTQTPKPKPVVAAGGLLLDAAIDRYLENVATKSAKTSSGYGYTLRQFYASTGNLLLSQIATQQLYDFVGYPPQSPAHVCGLRPRQQRTIVSPFVPAINCDVV